MTVVTEEAEIELDGPTPVCTVEDTISQLRTAELELTGAAVTLMSRNTQQSLLPKVELQPTRLHLSTYTLNHFHL